MTLPHGFVLFFLLCIKAYMSAADRNNVNHQLYLEVSAEGHQLMAADHQPKDFLLQQTSQRVAFQNFTTAESDIRAASIAHEKRDVWKEEHFIGTTAEVRIAEAKQEPWTSWTARGEAQKDEHVGGTLNFKGQDESTPPALLETALATARSESPLRSSSSDPGEAEEDVPDLEEEAQPLFRYLELEITALGYSSVGQLWKEGNILYLVTTNGKLDEDKPQGPWKGILGAFDVKGRNPIYKFHLDSKCDSDFIVNWRESREESAFSGRYDFVSMTQIKYIEKFETFKDENHDGQGQEKTPRYAGSRYDPDREHEIEEIADDMSWRTLLAEIRKLHHSDPVPMLSEVGVSVPQSRNIDRVFRSLNAWMNQRVSPDNLSPGTHGQDGYTAPEDKFVLHGKLTIEFGEDKTRVPKFSYNWWLQERDLFVATVQVRAEETNTIFKNSLYLPVLVDFYADTGCPLLRGKDGTEFEYKQIVMKLRAKHTWNGLTEFDDSRQIRVNIPKRATFKADHRTVKVKFQYDAESDMQASSCITFEGATVVHSAVVKRGGLRAIDRRDSGTLIICQVEHVRVMNTSLSFFMTGLETRMQYIEQLTRIHEDPEGKGTSSPMPVKTPVWFPIEEGQDQDKFQKIRALFSEAGAALPKDITIHENRADDDRREFDNQLHFHGRPQSDRFVGQFDMLRIGGSEVSQLGKYGAGVYFSKSAFEAQVYAGLKDNLNGLIIAVKLKEGKTIRRSMIRLQEEKEDPSLYPYSYRGANNYVDVGEYPDRLNTEVVEKSHGINYRMDLGELHALRDAPKDYRYISTPLSRPEKVGRPKKVAKEEQLAKDPDDFNTVVFSPFDIRLEYYITYKLASPI